MAMKDEELNRWFTHHVLPLEPQLLAYLRYHWDQRDEIRDILHDIYEKALIGASRGLPQHSRAFVFTIARNLLINRAKRARIVPFSFIADLGAVAIELDFLTPERHVDARRELKRVFDGMDLLPPRCREVVRLRKVEGLSIKEVAERMNVGVDAVERQATLGVRALTDFMLGGDGRIKRKRQQPVVSSRKGRRDE
jgi:RNA polymerase sigma factor (sigma-70 family)